MEDSKIIPRAASLGLTYNPEEKPDFYSSGTAFTNQIMLDIKCWVQNMIACLPQDKSTPFVFCDYGCSDGGKSVPVINEVIAQVRNLQGQDKEVFIVYEDQPENNFSAVFQKRGERLTQDPKVFTFACGLGFYNQCLPSSFVTLGFCSFGVHWLSHKPCGLLDAVYVHDGGTEEELAQYVKLSAKDWEVFLIHRATELGPGGFIRIISIAHSDGESRWITPRPASNPREGKRANDILPLIKKEMFQEGLITKEEMLQICVGTYMRNEDEIRAPFKNPDSPVRRAGLVLHAVHRKNYDCSLHAKYRRDLEEKGATTANRDHAKAMRTSAKAPLYPMIFGAMSRDRPQAEREKLANTFFERMEEKIWEEPDEYGAGMCTFHIDIHKARV